MVSVCLPSDALLQHLPSYLGFSYLGHGVSLTLGMGYLLPWAWGISYLGHGVSLLGCSRKAQQLLLTLDEGYLLPAVPDLQCGIAPLGLSSCACTATVPGLLLPATGPGRGCGWLLPAAAPGLGLGVAPQGHCPWPPARGGFSRPPLT